MTALELLLREMRSHLTRAAFAEAAALVPKIELALASLPPDPTMLLRLKTMAERNEAVIEAARRGIRAARRRVEEVRRATQGSQTYDGQGRRTDVASGGRLAGRF